MKKPDLTDKLIGRVGLEAEIERLRWWVVVQRTVIFFLCMAVVLFCRP